MNVRPASFDLIHRYVFSQRKSRYGVLRKLWAIHGYPLPPQLQNPLVREFRQQTNEDELQDAIHKMLVAVGIAKHVQDPPLNLSQYRLIIIIIVSVVIVIIIITIVILGVIAIAPFALSSPLSLLVAVRQPPSQSRRHTAASFPARTNASRSGGRRCVRQSRTLTAGLRPRSGSGPAGPG